MHCWRKWVYDKADAYPSTFRRSSRSSYCTGTAMSPISFSLMSYVSLDPELTGEVLKVIRQLAAEQMTMMVDTHEMACPEVADRVIFIDKGQIIERVTLEILTNPPMKGQELLLEGFLIGKTAVCLL